MKNYNEMLELINKVYNKVKPKISYMEKADFIQEGFYILIKNCCETINGLAYTIVYRHFLNLLRDNEKNKNVDIDEFFNITSKEITPPFNAELKDFLLNCTEIEKKILYYVLNDYDILYIKEIENISIHKIYKTKKEVFEKWQQQ